MKKYTLTPVDKLKVGDTFLKDDDPHEILYKVLPLRCSVKDKYYVQKGDLKMTDIVDINEPIIFLSNGK